MWWLNQSDCSFCISYRQTWYKYVFQSFNFVCLFQQVDCARKYVLVGNPVVSLDNISVFAIEERQEEIAKNRVHYLYSFVLIDFLLGNLTVVTSANFSLVLFQHWECKCSQNLYISLFKIKGINFRTKYWFMHAYLMVSLVLTKIISTSVLNRKSLKLSLLVFINYLIKLRS